MIRNIIWDVDGTLFDTYPAIIACFQAVLNANGCSAPTEHIASLVMVSLQHCADTLAAEFDLDPALTVEQFSARYAQVSPADQLPFPGLLQVIQAISALGGLNLVVKAPVRVLPSRPVLQCLSQRPGRLSYQTASGNVHRIGEPFRSGPGGNLGRRRSRYRYPGWQRRWSAYLCFWQPDQVVQSRLPDNALPGVAFPDKG
jgi:hypothetical protein